MSEEKLNPILKQSLSKELKKNIQKMEELLDKSDDLINRKFTVHDELDLKGVCFYTDGLVNTDKVETALKDMMIVLSNHPSLQEKAENGNQLVDSLIEHVAHNSSLKVGKTYEDAVIAILSGDTFCFFEQCEKGLIISSKGWDTRSVDEPSTEQVVRGPRDGFTENIRTNTALVRRRIKDPNLRIDGLNIGDRTKTSINIGYIKGIVKDGLVEEISNRLSKIDIDGILESNYIEEFIRDSPYSPFSTIMSTERPDKVAAGLLEGRAAIFVDNTPFVIIVPTHFWDFLQASDDFYLQYMTGSFFRIVRFIAFLISLTLPSIYVLLTSFHQEMIPTALALTIASGREIIPFPVLLEALLMELAFELMREAGLRMPKPIGQAVSIVGSLVIGQAAVQAGLVSPFMVIIVALTGISSFTIPNFSASYSIRLVRFPLLIASGTLGLLGFIGMFFILAVHALTIRSFGESYLSPLSPFVPSDQKDSLTRAPWWSMKQRPQFAYGEDIRQGDNNKPKPPKTEGDKNQMKDVEELEFEKVDTSATSESNLPSGGEKKKRKVRKPTKIEDLIKGNESDDS
ncbi:spore germination protein [Bacillaceae bacterium S4-13-58]